MKGVTGPEAKERALDWLEIMGLSEYAEMKLEKLSKGMQQKVQFIATVLHRPPLILLDEPFSGLDPINQDFFKELIKKLQEEGTTILYGAVENFFTLMNQKYPGTELFHQPHLVSRQESRRERGPIPEGCTPGPGKQPPLETSLPLPGL